MAGHRKLASFQLVQLTKHGVLHDDLHQGNLIMSNGWLFAIDFDRALISSEEAEVAAYVEWLREELVLQVSHSCFWCSDCWGPHTFIGIQYSSMDTLSKDLHQTKFSGHTDQASKSSHRHLTSTSHACAASRIVIATATLPKAIIASVCMSNAQSL
jgi:hypothetical protein